LYKNFGLIGKSLKHSFSKIFFENLFLDLHLENKYKYHLIEIDTPIDLPNLISLYKPLIGLNVTIPYKQQIISQLDFIDYQAAKIGAVNCIHFTQEGSKGYNTDIYGFEKTLEALPHRPLQVLIIGSGGAACSVAFVLQKLNIPFVIVYRKELPPVFSTYSYLTNTYLFQDFPAPYLNQFDTIINATPIGMYPNIDELPPLLYDHLLPSQQIVDLIYNPDETYLLRLARSKGCFTINGLTMFRHQAALSWDIWNRNI